MNGLHQGQHDKRRAANTRSFAVSLGGGQYSDSLEQRE
jgi:hypothetical protein